MCAIYKIIHKAERCQHELDPRCPAATVCELVEVNTAVRLVVYGCMDASKRKRAGGLVGSLVGPLLVHLLQIGSLLLDSHLVVSGLLVNLAVLSRSCPSQRNQRKYLLEVFRHNSLERDQILRLEIRSTSQEELEYPPPRPEMKLHSNRKASTKTFSTCRAQTRANGFPTQTPALSKVSLTFTFYG